jgi:beta-glucosidase
VAAHTAETVELARVLYDTSIVPERQQAAAAAQVLLSGVNSTSLALQQALRDSDIDGLKRSDPELYYSYGHSPPVYPSRKQIR